MACGGEWADWDGFGGVVWTLRGSISACCAVDRYGIAETGAGRENEAPEEVVDAVKVVNCTDFGDV